MPKIKNTNGQRRIRGYPWVKEFPSQLLVSLARTYNVLDDTLENHYKNFGFSKAKFNALFLLYKNQDGILLKHLGDKMLVSRANITGLIDRLEKDGLVQRISHPIDRRSILAQITNKGKNLMEEIIPHHIKLNNQLVKALSASETQQLIQLLDKLHDSVLKV